MCEEQRVCRARQKDINQFSPFVVIIVFKKCFGLLHGGQAAQEVKVDAAVSGHLIP